MKILKYLILLMAFCFILPYKMHAESTNQLFLNGKQLQSEVAPVNVDGNILVPVRIIVEQLGAKVKWDNNTRSISIQQGETKIELQIGNKDVRLNGKSIVLEAAPIIVDDNALVPVRFVSESLGLKVTWDDFNKSVYLFKLEKETPTVTPSATPTPTVTPTPTPPTAGIPTAGPTEVGKPTPGPTEAKTPDGKILTRIHKIDSDANQIVIYGDGELKANVFFLDEPDRFIVDLPYTQFQATLNDKEPIQNSELASNHPAVQKIRYAMFSDEPPTVRVVFELKSKQEYTLAEDAKNHTLTIKLSPKRYKVVIDAGHGDHDPGATSITKKKEKDFNLSITNKVYELLQKETLIDPYLTRKDDTFIELSDRAGFANAMKASVFLSIHGNSYIKTIRGTETYWYNPDSLSFAQTIHRHVVKAAGLPDRYVKKNNFKVLRETEMPAALLEVGYLSNAEDEAQMYTEDFQNRVAASIVAAIKEYLQIK